MHMNTHGYMFNDRYEHACLDELFLMCKCNHMLLKTFHACDSAMIVCCLCFYLDLNV